MKFSKSLFVPILFLSLFILASCGSDDSSMENTNSVKVKTLTAGLSSSINNKSYSGSLEGINKVKLSTKLMGKVSYLPFEAGSKIKKGEVLLRINSKDIEAKRKQVEANLKQAEAGFQNVEKNYNRIIDLQKNGSASQKELDDVTMGYKMAKAQVEAVNEMKNEINDVLSYSVLRAPFSGYIVNKMVQVGDLTAPGYPLLIVEDFSQFKVNINVSAQDIRKFNKDDKVKIKIDDVDNMILSGTVQEVNPGSHPASKQFQVQVLLDKTTDIPLKSGLFAKVYLSNGEEESLTIPENVLVKKGQLRGVYVVNNRSEASLRWLRLGKASNGSIEVLAGLSIGENIISEFNKVKEGVKVEVQQ